ALTADAHTAAGLAFGVGATLLVGGVALFSHFSGHPTRRANGLGQGGRAAMALRSSGRNQARSRLCVALMACASFVIVVVAANRVHGEIDVAERTSGAGGFTLVAETDVPLYGDLGRESPAAAAILGAAQVVPFRLLPGEDVSCLNLYQPERPRILGAPVEMVARGGFSFQQTSMPRDNPWQLLEEDLGAGVVPAIGDYNSVLWILHSGLGEDLVVENERGEPVRLRFVALLTKSLFQSEIVISEANFQRHFPSRTGYSYFLLDPEPTRAAEVAAGLESELVRLGFDAVATKDRLAAFQAVEDTYLSTFQTLGGLGLLLGTLGMGVILLRNVLERRSELAALRALGFRRRHLRGMVLMENAFLLLIGLAVGAAAGGAAAAPRLVAAGQDLPWLTLSLTLASVFAVGMLASTFASRAVTRLPLLASLQAR
ncbi:MAG: ABC transporter permease, partial [Acidobacteria bacterium]|nr:ABC transporter permease [Acidobacteriota bacterium]